MVKGTVCSFQRTMSKYGLALKSHRDTTKTQNESKCLKGFLNKELAHLSFSEEKRKIHLTRVDLL